MEAPQSKKRELNYLDENNFNEEQFSLEIREHMRVPDRIFVTGSCSNKETPPCKRNILNDKNYEDKFNMRVPNRIVVVGRNQYKEMYSIPPEIQLENSILSNNAFGSTRLPSPPNKITLNDYYSHSALPEVTSPQKFSESIVNSVWNDCSIWETDLELTTLESRNKQSFRSIHNSKDVFIMNNFQDASIDDLPLSETILYLNRQLVDLNRRLLNVEESHKKCWQREKIFYCVGFAYFFLKTIFWLKRH